MKTATIRDVQHHLSKVLVWVENGEEVEVTRRNKVVAKLVPSNAFSVAPVPLPDFVARARAIWGEKPTGIALSQAVIAGREERL